jgi:hypothetical protein
MKQGTLDAMAYLVSLGLTTRSDMGMFVIPSTPDMKTASLADGVESLNPWTAYDAYLALHREGRMTSRLRIFFCQLGYGAGWAYPERAIAECFSEFRRRHAEDFGRRRVCRGMALSERRHTGPL